MQHTTNLLQDTLPSRGWFSNSQITTEHTSSISQSHGRRSRSKRSSKHGQMSARPHQAQKQTQKKTPENGKSNTQITQKHPKHANTQKKRIQHARNAEWQAKLQGIVSTDHTLWSTYKITGGPRTQIPLKKFVLQNSSTGDAYYTDQEKAETLVSAFASVHEKASQISSPLEGLVSADIADHEEEELNRSHPPEQIQISPRLIAHLIRKSPKSSRTR